MIWKVLMSLCLYCECEFVKFCLNSCSWCFISSCTWFIFIVASHYPSNCIYENSLGLGKKLCSSETIYICFYNALCGMTIPRSLSIKFLGWSLLDHSGSVNSGYKPELSCSSKFSVVICLFSSSLRIKVKNSILFFSTLWLRMGINRRFVSSSFLLWGYCSLEHGSVNSPGIKIWDLSPIPCILKILKTGVLVQLVPQMASVFGQKFPSFLREFLDGCKMMLFIYFRQELQLSM